MPQLKKNSDKKPQIIITVNTDAQGEESCSYEVINMDSMQCLGLLHFYHQVQLAEMLPQATLVEKR